MAKAKLSRSRTKLLRKKLRIDPELEALAPYLAEAHSLDNLILNRMASASENLHQIGALLRQAVNAQAAAIAADIVRVRRKVEQKPELEQIETRISLTRGSALPSDVTPLDPFFRSRAESNAIRRTQTPSQSRRWAVYFERYGCLVCETKAESHYSNGMCHKCHQRTWGRLTH